MAQASDVTIGGTTAAARNIISGAAFQGVEISQSSNVLVEGNFIGTDVTGTHALPNVDGVGSGNQDNNITIGGATTTVGTGAGNLIAGNSRYGIQFANGQSGIAVVEGNVIGVANVPGVGTTPANVASGIDVINSPNAYGLIIGGTNSQDANVISGNDGDGILFEQGTGGVVVEGNLIGTDITGVSAVPNANGVLIDGGSSGNTIGGTTVAQGNFIAGNANAGVEITDVGTTGNVVEGDYLGIDATSTHLIGAPLGNGTDILIENGASSNTIGGTTPGARDFIDASVYGIDLETATTTSNVIEGDYIGLRPDGTTGGNSYGIIINYANLTLIGGPLPSERNIISGNGDTGVYFRTEDTSLLEGDYIGTDPTGMIAEGNYQGIALSYGGFGSLATIGGPTPTPGTGVGNVISGNTLYNIEVFDAAPKAIEGNIIGLNATGTASLGGASTAGIYVYEGDRAFTIGGTVAGSGNIISGNTGDGIRLDGNVLGPNFDIAIQGNFIGTDITGTLAIANRGNGVSIINSYANTIGGLTSTPGTGAGNLISGNVGYGVQITGASSTGNVVEGNIIGEVTGGSAAVAGDVAWYKFDQSATDYAGSNAGTPSGGYSYSAAKVGFGIYLDGTGLVSTPLTVSYGAGATFDAWISTTSANGLIAGDGGGFLNERGMALSVSAGRLILSLSTAGGLVTITGPAVADGAFHHVAATWTGDTSANGVKLYLDGVLVGSTTAPATLTTGSRHFEIGGHDVLAYPKFIGAIDEVNVFNRPLSASEIARIFANGSDGQGLGNQKDGVELDTGASHNTIGGVTSTARNVIGGNFGDGIRVVDATEVGTVIQGDYIGTDEFGTGIVGNTNDGIGTAGTSDLIGGPTNDGSGHPAPGLAPGNLISGLFGFAINAVGHSQTVAGNLIGLDKTGSVNLHPGENQGILLEGANDTIGGPTPASRNVVSGVGDAVVLVGGAGVTDNVIENNYFGTDITGAMGLGFYSYGLYILNVGTGNQIGAPGAGNVISAGLTFAAYILTAPGLIVQGNEIGTNAAGTAALPNADGLYIIYADGLQVGGTLAGAGNLISGNTGFGLLIGFSMGGLVQGNEIGTDVTGTFAIPNGSTGLGIGPNASNITVGGTTATARNLLSGNSSAGIEVSGAGTVGTLIEGNFIGVNATGTTALPNATYGIGIGTSALNTTIGGTVAGARNVVSGNLNPGIEIDGTGTPDYTAAYFKADGNTNDTANSPVGAATLVGGVTYGPGLTGQAWQFSNTAGQRVVETNDIDSELAATQLTLSAWINLNSLPASLPYVIASRSFSATSENYGLYVLPSGELMFEWYNSGIFHKVQSTGAALGTRIGSFQQVAVVADGSTVTFHVNGVARGSAGMSAALVSSQPGNLEIGGVAQGSNLFDGRIDELAIQTNPLAADEIARIYANAGVGVDLGGSGTEGTVVQGNFVGTDSTGTFAIPNGTNGVTINDALNTTIGGNTAGAGNLIGGNTLDGVQIEGLHATGNVVAGDKIGTDFSGLAPVATANTVAWYRAEGNGKDSAGSNNATIVGGGVTYAPGQEGQAFQFDGSSYLQTSLIDHYSTGVSFDVWINTTETGNPVLMDDGGGTTVASGIDLALGNGVAQFYGSRSINGVGNFLLSDNASPGINDGKWHHITATWTGDTTVNGVKLYVNGVLVAQGTAASAISGGSEPLTLGGSGLHAYQRYSGLLDEAAVFDRPLTPAEIAQIQAAGGHGVAVANATGIQFSTGASGNTIGGTTPLARDVISGNAGIGISLDYAGFDNNDLIEGDYIGVDATGNAALPNSDGIFINAGNVGETIGGTASGAGNVISGNFNSGSFGPAQFYCQGSNTLIEGNIIGLAADGLTLGITNDPGLVLSNAGGDNVTIGGVTAAAHNVISGNNEGIDASGITGLLIEGNFVGTDLTGTKSIGNNDGSTGYDFSSQYSTGITIGGTTSAARNLFAGSSHYAITLGVSTVNSVVEGNYIGLDVTGTVALANGGGVLVSTGGAGNNTIGGATSVPGTGRRQPDRGQCR